jgi:hypothetical protein
MLLERPKGEPHMATFIGVVGSMTVTYVGVRIGATVVDAYQRWRRHRAGDKNAWKVDGEE